MMELSGLQLYVIVGLPIVAVLASLTVLDSSFGYPGRHARAS
jgi:hypothetical protein